tara:strand:- start:3403 stop:3735 length:333 start_codon:yes stop_codon:yes gene_type:complete
MWLLERLQPDLKTIVDFRKDKGKGKGIKNACPQFVELCRQMNMFSDAVVAIDGSKCKAVNVKKNNFTPQKAKDHIARIESSISEYLSKLDNVDANAKDDKGVTLMKDKVA